MLSASSILLFELSEWPGIHKAPDINRGKTLIKNICSEAGSSSVSERVSAWYNLAWKKMTPTLKFRA
jgi:hypothetical protein